MSYRKTVDKAYRRRMQWQTAGASEAFQCAAVCQHALKGIFDDRGFNHSTSALLTL